MTQWERPRATAIAFVSAIAFIFACRYLPILKYAFKGTFFVLGRESPEIWQYIEIVLTLPQSRLRLKY
jgi:hypothetical protein